jgi:hypothetical protein
VGIPSCLGDIHPTLGGILANQAPVSASARGLQSHYSLLINGFLRVVACVSGRLDVG